jgi:peptidoglycan pentaglycine glycine transferase (the first glycine)
MHIIEIKSRKELDEFVGGIEHSAFQQSFGWGKFQEQAGSQIIRLGVEDGGKLIGAATLIVKRLPLGHSYLYCPRGPILINDQSPSINNQTITNNQNLNNQTNFNLLVEEIKKLVKEKKAIFLRFEPQFQIPNSKFQIHKTSDVQPSKTLILDLSKTEEELLSGMHPKTRYNVRLAEKKGVKISNVEFLISNGKNEEFEKFWKLMEETVKRDGFRLHGKEYYRKMLQMNFHESETIPSTRDKSRTEIKLYTATYKGKIIAGNIVSIFGDTATYVHGASSNEFRNVMAPFLLQWHCIKFAKKTGCKFYDFYGIDENKWPGVTRFKKGFGGAELDFPGTYDLPFSNFLYRAYGIMRKVRRAV